MLQKLLVWPKVVIIHLSCSGDSAMHYYHEKKFAMLFDSGTKSLFVVSCCTKSLVGEVERCWGGGDL